VVKFQGVREKAKLPRITVTPFKRGSRDVIDRFLAKDAKNVPDATTCGFWKSHLKSTSSELESLPLSATAFSKFGTICGTIGCDCSLRMSRPAQTS
jgi:hypothetical protein